jgi:antitoxin YefM
MKTVQLSETGNDLSAMLERVSAIKEGVKVVRDDGTAIVMLTAEMYRSLQETAFLLSSPANATHLAKSLAELRAGHAAHHELAEVSDSNAQPPVHE